MTSLSLVPAPDDRPPLHERDGLPVTWRAWKDALSMTHIDPSCEACCFPGPLRTCTGLVEHTPTDMEQREDRREQQRRKRPTSPLRSHLVVRLWAQFCPSCLRVEVYDLGPSGCQFDRVDLDAPTLFDVVT